MFLFLSNCTLLKITFSYFLLSNRVYTSGLLIARPAAGHKRLNTGLDSGKTWLSVSSGLFTVPIDRAPGVSQAQQTCRIKKGSFGSRVSVLVALDLGFKF
jgi:hypothetical protein